MTGPRPGEPGAYPYPGPETGVVPDRTDVALIESLAKQVQQQLRDPIGGRVMVTELDTGHGDLVNDAAAKASIGAAADALHVAAHGE